MKIMKYLYKYMRVIIIDSKFKEVAIDIDENNTIKEVKQKIINTLKMTHKEIMLAFNGESLEDDKLVSDYEIELNSKIVYLGKFIAGIYYTNFLTILLK